MNVTSTSQSTSLRPVPSKASPHENGTLCLTPSSILDRLESTSSIANEFRDIKGSITELQVYSDLTKKVSFETAKALANQKNGYLDANKSCWVMACHHYGCGESGPINDIFRDMEPLLNTCPGYVGVVKCLTLRINKESLNRKDIGAIFNQADRLYHANKDDVGLVVASKMSALWDHLDKLRAADKTFKISHKVLARFRKRHSSMFFAGDTINTFTPPVSGIIESARPHEVFYDGLERNVLQIPPIVIRDAKFIP